MKDDHMVEAFPPDGTNQPLDKGVLPGTMWRRQNLLETQVVHGSLEGNAEDSISIAKEVLWSRVPGKGLNQLLARPRGGRRSGDVEVQNLAAVVGEDEEDVEDLEGNRRYGEEVDGDHGIHVSP